MNRPYVQRGKPVVGVFQRCQSDCSPAGCRRGHTWTFMVELSDLSGQRRQVKKGGFVTGKDAAGARADVIRKHREGLLPQDAGITVAVWLRQWLVSQEEVRGLRDGTIVDYRRHIESYWIPKIGNVKLVDLRPQHVTNALRSIKQEREEQINKAKELKARYEAEAARADEERKRAGRKRPVKPKRVRVPRRFGPATALRAHATLRAALNAAMRAEKLSRNVAALADRPRETRRKVKPWKPEQLGAWLDAIAGERLYPLYHLGAFAGLRRGELCGVSWDDVDLDAGHIIVAWQITGISYRKAKVAEKQGQAVSYRVRPKTSDGEDRTVDLDAVTILVLRAWRRQQAKERLALGRAYRNRENLVFTRADGTPLDPDQVYKTFKRLARRHGLPDVALHHLRHGSASLQIEGGVDIAVISKRLGHSKISLTSDTYGHLIGTVGKSAAEAAAAVVPRRKTG
ncbi:tyrosine-type recombinase/integrase [Micromonospora zingiberis]|uniref:tyrosine-type recombinase/integrase n=1 Tax=Micromonospora zingiberis TaxID=2053011 RepID=UPI0013F3C925|nr:site-specific integrase [Micromonospora zingiberis]